MNVYLCQLKCPNNHCVIGAYGVYENAEKAAKLAEEVLGALEHACSQKWLNHECGICHATEVHAQVDRTPFKTVEEAKPFIDAAERDQARTREWFRRSKN